MTSLTALKCKLYVDAHISMFNVGEMAQCVKAGFHRGVQFVITADMMDVKPSLPWRISRQYWDAEFMYACSILSKSVGNMNGGEYFTTMKNYTISPAKWNRVDQPFPPKHESGAEMRRFGLRYHCDHFRTSGCPITLTIMRHYHESPDTDTFVIQISRGHHLTACNHVNSYNNEGQAHLPAIHPIIDMFIRAEVKVRVSSERNVLLAHIERKLKNHLRHVKALHCQYPHADESYCFTDRILRRKKLCCHAQNYATVATTKCYRSANVIIPLSEHATKRVGYSPIAYERTAAVWTHVYHMFMSDGHSVNGGHHFYPHLEKQIKARLRYWNLHFALSLEHDGPNLIADSRVGPMKEAYKDLNLFERFKRMQSDDPAYHRNLCPHEWCLIGLLIRVRTVEERNANMTRTGSDVEDDGVWEEGDFPRTQDPKNLEYEFVAVFAS